MDKQVICISWGKKYGAPYVNRLFGMVSANIPPPFRFVCFTDTTEGLHPDIEVRDLPPLAGPLPVNTPGQWPKSRLWGPELGGLEGPVLFLDLDVVVTGSLDPFFTYGDPSDVILSRNAAKPFQRLGQTSMYRMPVGALAPLFERFGREAQSIADEFQYEQYYVTANAPGGIKLWPRTWVRHFRLQCVPVFPLNYFWRPRVPLGTRVIIFAGALNPHDAVKGQYNATTPHLPPVQHLRRAWRRKKRWQAIRRFIHPVPWVEDAWAKGAQAIKGSSQN